MKTNRKETAPKTEATAVPHTAPKPEPAQAVPRTAPKTETAQADSRAAPESEPAQAVPRTATKSEPAQADLRTATKSEPAQADSRAAPKPEPAQADLRTAPESETVQSDSHTAATAGAEKKAPAAGSVSLEKKKRRRLVVNLLYACLLLLLVGSILFFVIHGVTGKVPTLFGYAYVRLRTDSMEPTLAVGTYILVEQVDPEKIAVEDIITFYSDVPALSGMANTHRVKEIIQNADGTLEFVTKGDNPLATVDSETAKADKLVGRYVKEVGWLTALYSLIAKPAFFFGLMAVVFFLVIFWVFKDIFKKEQKKSLTPEEKKAQADRLMAQELEKLRAENENQNKRDRE